MFLSGEIYGSRASAASVMSALSYLEVHCCTGNWALALTGTSEAVAGKDNLRTGGAPWVGFGAGIVWLWKMVVYEDEAALDQYDKQLVRN